MGCSELALLEANQFANQIGTKSKSNKSRYRNSNTETENRQRKRVQFFSKKKQRLQLQRFVGVPPKWVMAIAMLCSRLKNTTTHSSTPALTQFTRGQIVILASNDRTPENIFKKYKILDKFQIISQASNAASCCSARPYQGYPMTGQYFEQSLKFELSL